MESGSDRWFKAFGIALLILAVGYLLYRTALVIWGSIKAFGLVYQQSTLPPRPAIPRPLALAVAVAVIGAVPAGAAEAALQSTLVYPSTQKGDQVDDYHGVKVADP